MTIKSRIKSILSAVNLDLSVPEVKSFDLNQCQFDPSFKYELPANLRLGHLVERVISQVIQHDTNYDIVYENLQILEDKKTIGEIDFILKDNATNEIIHLELAYKFYLLDPTLSNEQKNNWIGPNRNDSMVEKRNKLIQKQFPLLFHQSTKAALKQIKVEHVSQQICFLTALFIPFSYQGSIESMYQEAICGYYLSFDSFINLNHKSTLYYIPNKKEWGIDPADNPIWNDFEQVLSQIISSIHEKQSILCWSKQGETYSQLFIVWW